MWPIRICLILAMGLTIAGCAGPGSQKVLASLPSTGSGACRSHDNIFFAEPLCDQYAVGPSGSPISAAQADADDAAQGAKGGERVEFVAAALSDSRNKCEKFITQFTGAQAADNTTLDIVSLILSGLGAVLTPANTVRALSAASTGVQGTKQAINTDLYQQMTMLLLVQQIQATYYKQLSDQYSSFPSGNTSALYASVELSKIKDIHLNCSIPFAAANLNATQIKQGSSNTATTGGATFIVTISGTITAGDTITLTPSSSTTTFPNPVSYKIATGVKTPFVVAANLIDAVYGQQAVTATGVLALPASSAQYPPSANTAQFTLQGGPADINWVSSTAGVSGAAATEKVTAVKKSQ
jgi:hypothetical protein